MRCEKRHGGEGRGEKGRHFVRGQGSLEFHTWINSPASGVRFTSFLLVLRLPLVPSSSTLLSPPPRGKPCYANSEIHPVQPLMNARELRQPPPPSLLLSQPPPTPRQCRTRECMTTSTWPMKSGTLSRGGVRSGCDIRAVIVLNLLRAMLFTLPLTPAGCVVHRSRNLTWLQIKPSDGYSQPPIQFRSRRTMIAGLWRNI